jgi:hypothetical protein
MQYIRIPDHCLRIADVIGILQYLPRQTLVYKKVNNEDQDKDEKAKK